MPQSQTAYDFYNMSSLTKIGDLTALSCIYEGCSNMNASSFITFFIYMLRQNVIPFWKELFVAFKMTPHTKKHSLYFSSYRPLYKGHSCILKFFWSKLLCTSGTRADIVPYLCKFLTKRHQFLDASLSNHPKVACRKKFIQSCFNLQLTATFVTSLILW